MNLIDKIALAFGRAVAIIVAIMMIFGGAAGTAVAVHNGLVWVGLPSEWAVLSILVAVIVAVVAALSWPTNIISYRKGK